MLKFLRDELGLQLCHHALRHALWNATCWASRVPSAQHAQRHRIRLNGETLKDPVFPTFTDLWPAANWMEREADFFGMRFTGHPNLKRILNMEDFPAFPMRKDYPLEDPHREDKDDRYFGR